MRGIVDGAIVAENFGSMGMSTDDCLFHKDIASRCSYADSEYEDLVKEFEEMLMADFMGYSQLKSEIDIEMMRDLQDLEDICQKGVFHCLCPWTWHICMCYLHCWLLNL